uniref:Uncharacterized protein n=1 Tax=Anguilla anguilla TaxID=7936 RepID=A0A0E9WDE0_ANGAN
MDVSLSLKHSGSSPSARQFEKAGSLVRSSLCLCASILTFFTQGIGEWERGRCPPGRGRKWSIDVQKATPETLRPHFVFKTSKCGNGTLSCSYLWPTCWHFP